MNKQTKELNQSNNELDKQINAENQEAFIDIICYLRGANISEYYQEVVRHDLLEMIISAQKRGETIQAVIGEDYKTFCDDIIISLPQKTAKEKFIEFFDILCCCLFILGTIHIVLANETITLIRNIITKKPLSFVISVSIGNAVSTVLIILAAFIIVKVIIKSSFNTKAKESMTKIKAFLFGTGSIIVFLFLAWIGKGTLFTVNIFIACTITLAFYITHRILTKI